MSHRGGDSTSDSTDAERQAADSDSASDTERGPAESDQHDGGDASTESGGLWRRIAVVLVGILLLATVAGANVTVAADRTVLDVDHVVEGMDEEGLFADETENVRSDVADRITAATDGMNLPPGIALADFDAESTAEESVTESHVREQMVGNLERLYAFLHGDREDLPLVFELGPVKSGIAESVTESATVDTPTFVGETNDRVDRGRVAALEESEESFQEARMDLDDRQVESMKADIESDVQSREYTPELTDALVSLQFTVVDGLAGELTYDEYTEQLEANERDLKSALGTEATAGVDDEITLGNEDEDPSEAFSGPADIVQLVSTLATALPLLAVGFVGLVGGITRDVRRTTKTTGVALLGAGVLGLVVGFAVPGMVLPEGGDGESNLFVDGFLAAVESMFGTIGTQSVVLTLGGVVLVGLVVVESRGLLDGLKGTVESDTEEGGQSVTGEQSSPDQPEAAADEESDTQVSGE